ncbi:hypothetical protein [Ekhidna sp.]|uniref:hypothetical protein n=1 Tax=Ekhidna sp. TaxID=2608089 RepID=UPI003CCBC1B5
MKIFSKAVIILIVLVVASCETQKANNQTQRPAAESSITNSIRVFDYQPEKPQNGELNAVIEVGSLGLNYFIIEIDDEARWVLKKQEFGRSNIIYGANSTTEIESNIKKYKQDITAFGVSPKNIYCVVSSSVIKENINDLTSRISNLDITTVTMTPENEAKYAMISTIPREFMEESFMVDVGSGNTKLAWVNSADTSTIEIHGSKYFLGDVRDTTVFREVRDALLEVPKENRNLCFILGGIIYEFAKEKIDNEDRRYYVLESPGDYPTNNEKLKAGNVIYSALYLEPTYSYIFDSESNFSIGYLVSLKK